MSAAGRRRPGAVLGAAALALATAAAGLVGPSSAPALAASGIGVIALALGVTRNARRMAAFGAIALLAGVLAAGAAGAPPERLLPSTAAALLAREFGTGAFTAQDELRGGAAERAEALHVAVGTGVGAVGSAVVYALYRALEFGVSPLGVVLLLGAVVALGLALRE